MTSTISLPKIRGAQQSHRVALNDRAREVCQLHDYGCALPEKQIQSFEKLGTATSFPN
jgi:hypothetical protein